MSRKNPNKDRESPDYIDWQEFNRMVARNGVPLPTKDSRGDTAFDENLEVRMGENYPSEVSDDEDEIEFGDADDAEDQEDFRKAGLSAEEVDDDEFESDQIVADSHSTLVNDMVDPEDLLDENTAVFVAKRPNARDEKNI